MAVSRTTRTFQRDGVWMCEVVVEAADKKAGMTVAEIRAALALAPIDVHPKFMVSIGGKVREIKYEMRTVPDDGEQFG